MKTFLLFLGLALCWAMFPSFVASAFALVVISVMLITAMAIYFSALFSRPSPR